MHMTWEDVSKRLSGKVLLHEGASDGELHTQSDVHKPRCCKAPTVHGARSVILFVQAATMGVNTMLEENEEISQY